MWGCKLGDSSFSELLLGLTIPPCMAFWGHSWAWRSFSSSLLPRVSQSKASKNTCNSRMAQACRVDYDKTCPYFVFPSALQIYFRSSLFPVAAIPKYPKPGSFKGAELYSLTVLEARSQNQGVCRVKALKGCSRPLSSLLVAPSNPWLVDASLLFLSFHGPLPCVSVSIFPSYLS